MSVLVIKITFWDGTTAETYYNGPIEEIHDWILRINEGRVRIIQFYWEGS